MRLRELLAALAFCAGCGSAAEDNCANVPAAQEALIGSLRCTRDGALQKLECGGWHTLLTCAGPELCSPGPAPGCRTAPVRK